MITGKFMEVVQPKPKYPMCENAHVMRPPDVKSSMGACCYAGIGKWFVTASKPSGMVALYLCDECLAVFKKEMVKEEAAITVQDTFSFDV